MIRSFVFIFADSFSSSYEVQRMNIRANAVHIVGKCYLLCTRKGVNYPNIDTTTLQNYLVDFLSILETEWKLSNSKVSGYFGRRRANE